MTRDHTRTETMASRLTPEERAGIVRAAEREGRTVAEWLREVARAAVAQSDLAATRTAGKELVSDPKFDAFVVEQLREWASALESGDVVVIEFHRGHVEDGGGIGTLMTVELLAGTPDMGGK